MAPVYAPQMMHSFFIGLKSDDPVIRISSLSNMGQLCGVLRFSLQSYIMEIMSAITALLKTDPSLEVKRASTMFLTLMLSGIDKDCVMVSLNTPHPFLLICGTFPYL